MTASGVLGGPSGKEEPVSKARRAGDRSVEVTASGRGEEVAETVKKSPTSSRGTTSKSSKGKSGSEKAPEGKAGKKEGDGEPDIKQEEPETFDPSEYAKENGISIDDLVYISSDGELSGDAPVVSRERTPERPLEKTSTSWMRPIRIGRHEHIERAKGVNTEASSAKSAQPRRQMAHHSEDQEPADEAPHRSTVGRGKSKGKEVQFVRERKAKGVNREEHAPVKAEPRDIVMTEAPDGDAPSKDAGPSTKPSASDEPIDEEDDDVAEPHKRRRRRHPVFRPSRPALQTDEDHAEWDRHERDLQAIAEELGGPAAMAQEGDKSHPADASESEHSIPDQKQDLVYLFQLPPFLPNLVPEPDAHHTGDDANAMDVDSARSPIPADVEQVLAKHDEVEPLDKASRAEGLTANGKAEFSGRIGTLTVYESGVSTFTWGGIEHELSRAPPNEMLQEVLVTDWPEKPDKKDPAKRDEKADEREEAAAEKEKDEVGKKEPTAWSMGQIVGGFVVTPNWVSLFDSND